MFRQRRVLRIVLAFLLVTSLPMQSFAWGREGHHIIALIAQSRLTDTAKTKLIALLGAQTLAEASTWPDEIRKDHPETAGWHYVSIPRSAPFFDEERDCFQPDPARPEASANSDHHNCAVVRIDMFTRIAADTAQPKAARIDALKYLIHFLSDLHQPMHAMGEARGGNDIKIVQFGQTNCGDHPCNLHGLWDSGLIDHAEPNEQLYAHHLEVIIARDRLDLLPEGTPRDWANESHVAAEGALLENGGAADQIYFDHEISVVDRRLSMAAIRLARVVNSLFGPSL